MRRIPAALFGAAVAITLAAPLTVESAQLPFIKDDYTKALAQARQRHVPMFVEVWAPW